MMFSVHQRSQIDPSLVEEIVLGNVLHKDAQFVTRVSALAAGFPCTTAISTVNRWCSSGLLAVEAVAQKVALGSIEIGIVVGAESMSMNPDNGAPLFPAEFLQDRFVKDTTELMPWTAENVSRDFRFTRERQDELVTGSIQRAEAAHKILRPEHLMRYWYRKMMAFVAPGDYYRCAAERLQQPIIGKFVKFTVVGLEPRIMGVGPIYAIPKLLAKVGISTDDVDIFEINKAFTSMGMGNAENTMEFWTFRNVVAGELRASERAGHGINPSNREPLWAVPIASAMDLDDAVSAAREAFPKWSKIPWTERQDCLRQARTLLQQHRPAMAQLLLTECGKPQLSADLEVQHAIDAFDFYVNLDEPKPEIVQDDDDLRLTLTYGPMGVVGAICPWNFPLVLACLKFISAILAGNCVIIKPSPYTPYSILKLVEIIHHLFPPGALQVMHGDNDLGPLMCNNDYIDKISFTGSTATGKKIMAAASKSIKKITLELGGNSASVVCRDVDIDKVATEIAIGSFFNSGQLCVASKRLYVHKDIYDAFIEKMVNVVRSWKVGPSSGEEVFLGPVQNEMQYNFVKSIIQDTEKNGYNFALKGGPVDDSNFVIRPSIVDNPPDDSLVVTAEAFVPVQSWTDEDELISRVNNTKTGLGGAVWSSNIDYAHHIAARIEAGTIWINSFEKPLPQAFLSGHKESGIGGEWGLHGLLGFCNAQMIHYYKTSVAPKTSNTV
ncbi:putative aldehyde dehydrogenase FUS7 [Paramyrothecium foliicola]|nr:putative aldehyde dehydrogenase FUS7 [Paramyrothecium foliicola]